MIKRLTLVVGLGAGYVLGAKAGKERYEQIMKQVNGFLGRPEVQNAADNVSSAVTEKASAVADTAKSKVADLTSSEDEPTSGSTSPSAPTVTGTAAPTAPTAPIAPSGPIPGAATSDTV